METSITGNEPAQASKGAKLWNKIIVIALIIIALSVGLFLSWEYQGSSVLNVKNSPFPTRVIEQNGEGAIVLTVDYCKTQRIDGSLRISYVSASREIFLPLTTEKSGAGCQKSELPILIPKDLPSDTYRLKFHIVYDINPIKQNVVQEFFSQPVEINDAAAPVPTVTPAQNG